MSEGAMQLQCECENLERRSYHYRRDPVGIWRCEQCDGILAGERPDAIPSTYTLEQVDRILMFGRLEGAPARAKDVIRDMIKNGKLHV